MSANSQDNEKKRKSYGFPLNEWKEKNFKISRDVYNAFKKLHDSNYIVDKYNNKNRKQCFIIARKLP